MHNQHCAVGTTVSIDLRNTWRHGHAEKSYIKRSLRFAKFNSAPQLWCRHDWWDFVFCAAGRGGYAVHECVSSPRAKPRLTGCKASIHHAQRIDLPRANRRFTARHTSLDVLGKATWSVFHIDRRAAIAASGRKEKKLSNTSCSFVGNTASMKVLGAWPRR